MTRTSLAVERFKLRRELDRLRRQIQNPEQGATLAGQMLQDSAFLDYAKQHEVPDTRTSVRIALGREGLVAVGRSEEDVVRILDYIRDGLARQTLRVFLYKHPSAEELTAVEGLALRGRRSSRNFRSAGIHGPPLKHRRTRNKSEQHAEIGVRTTVGDLRRTTTPRLRRGKRATDHLARGAPGVDRPVLDGLRAQLSNVARQTIAAPYSRAAGPIRRAYQEAAYSSGYAEQVRRIWGSA